MAHRWHFTHRCPACRQVGPPYLHCIFCGESPWPMVPPRQVLPSCRPLESLMRRPPVEQTEAIQLHPKHQCGSTRTAAPGAACSSCPGTCSHSRRRCPCPAGRADGGLEAADLQMARFVGGTQQHTTTRRPFNQKGFGSLHSGIWPSRAVS